MNSLYGLMAGIWTASLALAQGAVFQVSPTGAIADVQTAVNLAGNGDLIEVAPGVYPPFAITGKHLAIVGIDPVANAPANFTVSATPNTPAIRIDNLAFQQFVTISGVRIAHSNTTAPAITIANNLGGGVRLLDVVVTTSTALGSVPYDGILEVASTGSLWLDRVRIGDHRVFGNGASGIGLAALLCDTTPLHLYQCDLRGLRSATSTLAGGDGVRTLGMAATTWIVDSVLYGGMSLAGAAPFTLGGHPVHDYGGQAGQTFACDCTLTPAVHTVSTFAVAGVSTFLAACPDEAIGGTSLTPFASSLRIGSSTTVSVSAKIGNRLFVLVIAEGFGHIEVPSVFTGAILYGSNAVSFAGGVVGATPLQLPLTLPFVPAAIGMHLTLQAGLLDPATTPLTWAMTTAAGFTVR